MNKIQMTMSKECLPEQKTKPAARPRFWLLAILALGVAGLCGCSSEAAWKSQSFALALPDIPPATALKTNVVVLRRVTISPLFQGRSFIYRTGADTYEHDPYAGFFVPPERAIEQPIRAWLRDGDACGCVSEPGSGLTPSLTAEVSVNELYGDFRKVGHPAGVMEIHFILYEIHKDGPGRVLLDKVFVHQAKMAKATPVALADAWDTDLREIMVDLNSALKQLSLN